MPDLRSAWWFLWWLTWAQRRRVLAGVWWGSLWMCGLTVPPYLIQRAVEDGLRGGDRRALVWWCVALLVTAVLLAITGMLRHRTMSNVRADASLRTAQVVVRHVAELGGVVRRKLSSGELAYVQNGDTARIAFAMTVTGPGVGAVVAYAVTAVLLVRISPLVAAVVLLGVPVLVLLTGPVLKRLHAVEAGYRDGQAELTARAGDVVAGLRVLAGIGGRPAFEERFRRKSAQVRADGYRVASWHSWAQVMWVLPTLFLAVVTWVVARMAVTGEITVPQLVAVYLYVTTLAVPVSFFVEGADSVPRALVSARRVVALLSLRPDDPSGEPGLEVERGALTVVVPADAAAARRVVEPLGLVADNDDYLFPGTVRDAVSVAEHDDVVLERAFWAAAAADVVAAMPDGLDSRLEAQGRNVSGGQRQRLRLVRALLSDPDVLVLVEPTSALDAVTEAVVARRVRRLRSGRTTVVVSSSPLWAGQADHVVHLDAVLEETR